MACKAKGNLFLFGEHAAVYGMPAVIVSIANQTFCSCTKLKERKIIINSRELGKAEMNIDNLKKSGNRKMYVLLDSCYDFMKTKNKLSGMNVKIKSQIPVSRGMSSSTAVLCSMLEALAGEIGIRVPKKKYFYYLFPYQKILHGGRASGTEFMSSVYGGVHYVRKVSEKLRCKKVKSPKMYVVIGDTGIKVDTSKTVGGHIPRLMKRRAVFVEDCFNRIKEISKKGRKLLVKNNLKETGKLMVENQKILAELGVSHPKLERAVKAAVKAGAYGAKLSGKGQGGIMFAITSKENQNRVAKAIKNCGLAVIKTCAGA